MSSWRAGIITAKCLDGDKSLPGWISEPFGIDWGIDKDSREVFWIIHHLPTGYRLFALRDDISAVDRLIALLRSLGDWLFTDPKDCRFFSDTPAIVKAAGFDIWSGVRVGRPQYPDCVEEVL